MTLLLQQKILDTRIGFVDVCLNNYGQRAIIYIVHKGSDSSILPLATASIPYMRSVTTNVFSTVNSHISTLQFSCLL